MTGATSEVSGATRYVWKALGVFNFGGPYPPKNPNQKIRDRWKTLQKALTCPKNTPARTLILKNKEREREVYFKAVQHPPRCLKESSGAR
jgi:hypothetical protein